MKYANIRVEDSISIQGAKLTVLEIETTAYSDMGCGPVFDITTIKCKDKHGNESKITVEEGI